MTESIDPQALAAARTALAGARAIAVLTGARAPNAGHRAIAALEASATHRGVSFCLITQNVDGLGSVSV